MTRKAYDLLAEQSVLGACLMASSAFPEASLVLTGRDFYRPDHELIWSTIERLAAAGEPNDAVTVGTELVRAGEVKLLPEGLAYLHTLQAVTPVVSNVGYYARIVAEWATARRLANAGAHITQLGESGPADVDVVAAAEAALSSVTSVGTAGTDATNFGTRIDDLIDELDTPEPDPDTNGICTGFLDLDQVLQPMRPGQMIVVGARPSVGKSTFVRDIARHAAFAQQRRVLLHTLEMSRDEVEAAIVAAEGRILLERVTRHSMDLDDLARLGKARGHIDGSTLIIDGDPILTLARLRASVRRHRPDLVVVDQLQLMTPDAGHRGASRQEDVAGISRGLKLLAKAEGVPVLVCSKLNRESERAPDKVPTMAMLRDSGEIESDADVVLLLHREDMYERESPRAGELDVIVEKQRTGGRQTVTLAAQLHYARFVDLAWTPHKVLGLA